MHEHEVQPTKLFEKIRRFFMKGYENLNQWTEALDCLVHPE